MLKGLRAIAWVLLLLLLTGCAEDQSPAARASVIPVTTTELSTPVVPMRGAGATAPRGWIKRLSALQPLEASRPVPAETVAVRPATPVAAKPPPGVHPSVTAPASAPLSVIARPPTDLRPPAPPLQASIPVQAAELPRAVPLPVSIPVTVQPPPVALATPMPVRRSNTIQPAGFPTGPASLQGLVSWKSACRAGDFTACTMADALGGQERR